MLYSRLGWLNVFFYAILTAPYWLVLINKKYWQIKDRRFAELVKYLRQIHKPLAVFLIFLALLHGYFALGGFQLHTGSLVFFSLFLTAIMGGGFYQTKKKNFFVLHKGLALLTGLVLLLHLFLPGLFSGLF